MIYLNILLLILICLESLYLFLLYKKYKSPVLPVSLNVQRRRQFVTYRLAWGTPRLCAYHISVRLRLGQMAILDPKRCEICLKQIKITPQWLTKLSS